LIEEENNMEYAVIMAGGSGTRLWPLSRENTPKQSLKLAGTRTMFQQAVDRLFPLFSPERVFVVTRAEHADILKKQSPEIPACNFIIEPEGRGTAPAIGLAAIHLRAADPDAVMAVLTADHAIKDIQAFQTALQAGAEVAKRGYLVTMGIKPESPSTGFGYIEQGETLEPASGLPVYQVERFIEKPSLETAARMVQSGEYSWNSGMFIWKITRILKEFQSQMPGFYAQLEELAQSVGQAGYDPALARTWPKVGKQTIDYGIMEGAGDVAVIPVNIGWSDVGSWSSLFELLPLDANGNAWTGEHVAVDTRDTLVFSTERLVTVVGVQGLIIVDTPDALLVCARGREQDVREVVRILKESGKAQYL
jgi:mannose-1-phosphate guanylyltransferase